jgi:hypothetical protein
MIALRALAKIRLAAALTDLSWRWSGAGRSG